VTEQISQIDLISFRKARNLILINAIVWFGAHKHANFNQQIWFFRKILFSSVLAELPTPLF
jgi:hypothetical protein